MTLSKVKIWRRGTHLVVLTTAVLAIAYLAVEDDMFPLAKRQPPPLASTFIYQWNGFSRDAKSRVSEWLDRRNSLLDRMHQEGGLPKLVVAKEIYQLNVLELDYLQWASNSIPMFLEILSQYIEVLKLGGQVEASFRSGVQDYKTVGDVYPKILECQKKVRTDTQTLGAGLNAKKDDEVSRAIVAMTLNLMELYRSAKNGNLAHCGDELSQFEEAYGRLAARYPEVTIALEEHAKQQERERQVFHWLAIMILIFMPSLPEGIRCMRDVFS
jgi:hypothetical protein